MEGKGKVRVERGARYIDGWIDGRGMTQQPHQGQIRAGMCGISSRRGRR